MEAKYGTYEYEKQKAMQKQRINFCYRQDDCLITPHALSLTNDCSCHFQQHHPQLSPPLLVHFCRFVAPLQHRINQTLDQTRLQGGCKQKNHHILGAMNFEVHFHHFSKAQTRAGCGVTIYLGITREAYHIFYGFILLMQDIFYSLLKLLD